MEWFEIREVASDTFAIIEDQHVEEVRSYLVMGETKAVLIDTGLGVGNIKKVVAELTDLPVTVLLTHVHWDHIAGAEGFDDLLVHELDQEWLETGIPTWDSASVRKELAAGVTGQFPLEFVLQDFHLFKGRPTGSLRDGQLIDLGGRQLRILHTPGHSPGHVSVFDETNGILFPGDILYVDGKIYAHYPSTDPQQLLGSLEKIAALTGVKQVFASHNKVDVTEAYFALPAMIAGLKDRQPLKHGMGTITVPPLVFQF